MVLPHSPLQGFDVHHVMNRAVCLEACFIQEVKETPRELNSNLKPWELWFFHIVLSRSGE